MLSWSLTSIALCSLLCWSYITMVASMEVKIPPSPKLTSKSVHSGSDGFGHWERLFSSADHLDDVSFTRESAIELAMYLKAHHRQLKYYNSRLCPLIDGAIFKTITGVAHEPEHLKLVKSVLLNKNCIKKIPEETWSLLSESDINRLGMSISQLPSLAVPHLQWNVFKAALKLHYFRTHLRPIQYNGWCKLIKPHQFSREIWTSDLWTILNGECVADMHTKKSQLNAIRLIAENPKLDVPNIGRPELREVGYRIVRLQSIKRALHSDHHVAIQLTTKYIEEFIGGLNVLFQQNISFLQKANRKRVLCKRISFMDDILKYAQLGSSNPAAKNIISRFLKHYELLGSASTFTWEAISKFAVKNPSLELIEYISSMVCAMKDVRLPIDSIVSEAIRTGSTRILLAIIDCTKNKKLLGFISRSIGAHKKKFGSFNSSELFRHIAASRKAITKN